MIDENGKIFVNKYSYTDGFVDWDIFQKTIKNNEEKKTHRQQLLFVKIFFGVSVLLFLLNHRSNRVSMEILEQS